MAVKYSRKDVSDTAVCLAYEKYTADNSRWPCDILQEELGVPFKVCYRAMIRAERRGYIDYGVSLRSGWLTEAGEGLIGHGDD